MQLLNSCYNKSVFTIMKYLYQVLLLNDRKILAVLNPESDNGKSLYKWRKEVLPVLKIRDNWIKKEPSNLLNLIKKIQPKIVVVGGGDGTLNFVARTILNMTPTKRPLFAVLPLGHGNAVAYNLGIDSIHEAAELLIDSRNTTRIDVIKTNIPNHPYCLFNISLGFDAQIVKFHQDTKYIGFFSYVISGIRSIIDYHPRNLSLLIDFKVKLTSETVSLIVANGPYIGHKYEITPESSMSNGHLDCVLFPSKYAYLTNLRWRGFVHPLYSKKGKVYFQAKTVEINNAKYIQIDGDPIDFNKKIILTSIGQELKCVCK